MKGSWKQTAIDLYGATMRRRSLSCIPAFGWLVLESRARCAAVPPLRLEKIGSSDTAGLTKESRSAAEAISGKAGAGGLDGISR